jgi:hypothetical protein
VDWNHINSLYYDSEYGENVWEYYFEKIDGDFDSITENILNNYIEIKQVDGLNLRETFNKYYFEFIKLNSKTQEIIELNTSKVDSKTLGLHLRKTDKYNGSLFNEPMAIPIDDKLVVNLIDSVLNNFDKIYLATDCIDTYEFFLNKYPKYIIPNNKLRGRGLNAIHTSNKNNGYIKGLESLIDCYSLSKCGFLIKSTSNLSCFSMFLNLKLECINLNEVFRDDKREHEFNIYSKKKINYEDSTNWVEQRI